MDRLVFHVDVNSAFLSWEAAKRVREGLEDIRLIPSVIGGDREKRTGVVLAKSIPAKKYGIRTGEPITMALRKYPKLFIARPDFGLYTRCSKAFMDICREYTPVVEPYSIDECFLDMSGMGRIYPDPVAVAYEIKSRIYTELGFTVNVGVGPNKILAKMASDFEKPNKVHTLFEQELESKLWPLPVGDLFSVGSATKDKLIKGGINTIGDLAKADLGYIQRIIGQKWGEQLHQYANGIDSSPVLDKVEDAKGYSNSTTLEKDVKSSEEARMILLALTDSVAARMRADNVQTFCVGVTIRSNEFKDRSHQRKLHAPTDVTSEIYEVVQQLFDELWDGKTPLRLLGVSLTNVVKDPAEQTSLFPDERKDKSRKVDKAVDSIRGRFGSGTIVAGANYKSDISVGRKHKAQLDENEK